MTSVLDRVSLQDFGTPAALPELPASLYLERIAAAVGAARRASLDALVVYADREHFANMAYLTGFDPRFEEALLVLGTDGTRKLVVGNECMGYLPDPALGLQVEIFQEFSLLGQPRGQSRPLRRILRDGGIRAGTKAGCVGWKYFHASPLIEGGAHAVDLPGYLVDLLRGLCGDAALVRNATNLFMDPQDGLRVLNEPAQIAQFEYASCVTSAGVLDLLQHLTVGAAENDLEKYLDSRGLPLTCHRMISFGDKAKRGLASATARRAVLGDAFTTAFGVTGALTCRAGAVASRAADLPPDLRDFYPRFARNYFDVVATWYEHLHVDATAADVFRAVQAVREPALFDFAVNPGHYLHLDEWLHSPFAADSTVRLRSGMALQADIIPVSNGPFCYVNAEDGIVLADRELQSQLAASFPDAWARMEARRTFVRDVIGIQLDDTVLPLSNIPAWLPPYALDPGSVLVRRPTRRT